MHLSKRPNERIQKKQDIDQVTVPVGILGVHSVSVRKAVRNDGRDWNYTGGFAG
jgi:hypothetical protein